MDKLENVTVRNISSETKRKVMFVLKAKGKTMSDVIRETLNKYEKEFDEIIKKEE